MANKIDRPCAAANFLKGRPAHFEVEAVVIHLIDGTQAAADQTFADPALVDRRSAHYSIGRDGTIHQYVAEEDTAYHAGVLHNPTWSGLRRKPDGTFVNPNFYTIGIEHEGRANDPWPDAMYEASAELLSEIAQRHPRLSPLTLANVVGHREIRSNKSCPGSQADLRRLIRMAGGVAPEVPEVLIARSNVNVRSGQPSTKADLVRTIPAGELVNVRRKLTGESVNGVSVWYQNMDDDFVWGGALAP
jgi:N-acetyl-anhydromuramyl-L-alanine amidase AmpD